MDFAIALLFAGVYSAVFGAILVWFYRPESGRQWSKIAAAVARVDILAGAIGIFLINRENGGAAFLVWGVIAFIAWLLLRFPSEQKAQAETTPQTTPDEPEYQVYVPPSNGGAS
jgi:hypothetical protein